MHPKCLFCRQRADPNYPWESTWSISIAESMEKLIELEEFPSTFFEMGDYCRSCKELIRDVDFVTRSRSALNKRLDTYRTIIAEMLLENFEEWTSVQNNGRVTIIDGQEKSNTDNATNHPFDKDHPFSPANPIKSETAGMDEDVKEVVDNVDNQSDFGLAGDAIDAVDDDMGHQISQKETRVVPDGPKGRVGSLESDRQCSYPDCGMEFHSLQAFQTHSQLHVGRKPFKCTKKGCWAAYTRQTRLNDHLRTGRCKNLAKDSLTEIHVVYQCNYVDCEKGFRSVDSLQTHAAKHIGWMQFQCSHAGCSAKFSKHKHLAEHLRTLHIHETPNNGSTSATMLDQTPGEVGENGIEPEAQNQSGSEVNSRHIVDSSSLRRSCRIRKKPTVIQDSDTEVSMDSDPEFEPSSTSEDEVESAGSGSDSPTGGTLMPAPAANYLLKRATARGQLEVRMDADGNELIRKGVLELATKLFCTFEEIQEDVIPCFETNGKIQTWQSVGILDNESPPDTFNDTVCHLLQQRMRDAEAKFSIRCPSIIHCPRRFIANRKLRIHINRVHEDFLWPFQCAICSYECFSEDQLNVHMSRTHDGDKFPYMCKDPSCISKFKVRKVLENHSRIHDILPEDELTLGDKQRLIHRLRMAKGERLGNMIRCSEPECKYRTLYPKHLEDHKYKVHQEEVNPYHCKHCDAKLKSQESYRYHLKSAHGKLEGVVCQFCGFRSKTAARLTEHVRNKHRDVAEEFRCSVCTHAYFTPEDCKSHEERHAQQKTFNCVLSCENRSHATRDELIQHVQNVHEGVKSSVCETCGFTSKGMGHIGKMQRHMRVHTRVKTWKCKYCDRTFLNCNEIQTHTQIHHADEVKKKYTCADCQEEFKVYQYYYRHRRNKHGNPIPPFKRKRKVVSEADGDDSS